MTTRGLYDNGTFMMLSRFEIVGTDITESTRQIVHKGNLVYLEDHGAVKRKEAGPWQDDLENIYWSALK